MCIRDRASTGVSDEDNFHMRDDGGANLDNGGANFSPEQIALFTLHYENGYDLLIDPDYVSWLLENHPEEVPADIVAGVSDPFQPFDDQIIATESDMADFTMDSSAFDLPECYVDE